MPNRDLRVPSVAAAIKSGTIPKSLRAKHPRTNHAVLSQSLQSSPPHQSIAGPQYDSAVETIRSVDEVVPTSLKSIRTGRPSSQFVITTPAPCMPGTELLSFCSTRTISLRHTDPPTDSPLPGDVNPNPNPESGPEAPSAELQLVEFTDDVRLAQCEESVARSAGGRVALSAEFIG